MSRSRVLPLTLAVCAATLAASGCAAGFDPYTSPSIQPRDAANYPAVGSTSPLAIRHAFVLGPSPDDKPYAKGDDAALYLSVVNQSPKADRLVSVSSSAAKETVVAAGTGKPSGSSTSSGSGDKAATKQGSSHIQIPAPIGTETESDPVGIGQPPYAENTVTLTGLTRGLRDASMVRVTFQFQRAGDITMQLPVMPRAAQRESLSPAPSSQSPTGTPTGSVSPTKTPTESPSGATPSESDTAG